MSRGAFIERFRELHEKAKAGSLSPMQRAEYEQSRRELGRLMLVAQQMNHRGQTLRAALRIAQLIKVELDLGGPSMEKTSTMDLASGGFAALLPGSQPLGRLVTFKLQVPAFPSGTQPLGGSAKVASSHPQGGLHRVSFAFAKLTPEDQEHLDMVIIDFVLRRFTTPG
ncbi:MAG TPA: PilZ domain-containing protein [Labilithrix sp.]|nr:PilZ domain-containing protein [Labilithrix sp.]